MNLRKLARGKPCQVRIPEVCDGGGETTVLAHFRLIGVSGMGLKSPDLTGAWCCGPCHAYVDSRHDDLTQLMLAHGVFRTINALVKDGVLT